MISLICESLQEFLLFVLYSVINCLFKRNQQHMKCPTILFVSPRQGGILQSSGFLDLPSLMSLSRTCKAHALDELSLIQLIENEITRNHKCHTMEEAIYLLRRVYRVSQLKRWLERNVGHQHAKSTISIIVRRDMLSVAVRYEVMFTKMLRAIPEYERLPMMRERTRYGGTLLHAAARWGNVVSIQLILALYPSESERLKAVSMQDTYARRTVLHYVAQSGSFECFEAILALYPESQLLSALSMRDRYGGSVLRRAAQANNIEMIQTILSLYPESERQPVLDQKAHNGLTVLDEMDGKTRGSIVEWLSRPESSGQKRSRQIEQTSVHEQSVAKRHKSENEP